jgi:Uma2 family endonuclease
MPRILENAKQMTFEEYLEFEKTSEVRHEFVDGFVFAMAGANNAHNVISGNIFASIHSATRKAKCQAYMNDMKLRTPGDKGYYPDVLVVCEKDDLNTNVKTTACFIVETLSDSTQDIDRGEKWENYRKTQTLQSYILVSQKKKLIEVYKRQRDGSWLYSVLEHDNDLLPLPCINLELSLGEIYENVDFSTQES